ncbi:efflux RND transporter periplasmic adaptor subunit [Congregibacter sp.]|uniref:efflux RND transporter periplasmic adaptor subunit n=1 Tax=Congregibacter sp. TaxID=2744308 RepID=UPI003F6CB5D2
MTNQTSMNTVLRRPAVIAAIAVVLLIALAAFWPDPSTKTTETQIDEAEAGESMPGDMHAGHGTMNADAPAEHEGHGAMAMDTHAGHEGHGEMQSPATHAGSSHPLEQQSAEVWSCSMHPHIKRDGPGQCPMCGMDLIPVQQEPSDMDDQEPRQLTLSTAQRARMRIATVPVERRYPTAEIRLVGKVSYDETRLAYITAWVPGRIDELFVDYTGVTVRKGDHMVGLYSPELLSAQEELLQAIRGMTELSGSNVESLRRSAAGTVEAARDKLRLWGLSSEQIAEIERSGKASEQVTIFSPASGVVIHRNAQEGMYVDTGTRIFTVADLDAVWVQLDAYESDLQWLRYGQTVNFTTEAYPGERFNGVVSFIDPVLNPQTRTVNVRVNVDNKDGRLKPEMFVRAEVFARFARHGQIFDESLVGKWVSPMHPEIIKDEPGQCDICGMDLVPAESLGYASASASHGGAPLVIPATAALLTGKRAVVYIEQRGAERPTYVGREVVLGPRAGDSYVVESGLSEGDLVVVSGNFKIDSALQIQAKPSMMNPEGGGSGGGHDHGSR